MERTQVKDPDDIETDPVQYLCVDRIVTLTLNSPPVNALNIAVRSGLWQALEKAQADPEVKAVILSGKGKGFCAGGDIHEFGTPAAFAVPGLSLHLHPAIEAMSKPVIAAIHGFAIGGGLETAMACHYRVVEKDARIGLPEVQRATIPLSGTQRLPRVVGLARAIEMILCARIEPAAVFAGTALFDYITEPGQALVCARHLAQTFIERNDRPLPLIRQRAVETKGAVEILALVRAELDRDTSAKVPRQALEAIAASVESLSFDEGMLTARGIYDALMVSHEVGVQRELFFKRE